MPFTLNAACLCDTGRVRGNNEDNFFFDETSLLEQNNGLSAPLTLSVSTAEDPMLAVFDGMGGEAYGETASFTAAKALYAASLHIRREDPEKFLREATQHMNLEVFRAGQALGANRMGSTLAMLYFLSDHVFACNVGDSRIFRLREGNFNQLSQDHTDEKLLQAQGIRRRPRLTQHLGIDPEDMRIVPCIGGYTLKADDWYLICSDGLTDMLTAAQVTELIRSSADPDSCVRALVSAALEKGGRDNVTVIACHIL